MRHRLKAWQRENPLKEDYQLIPAPDGRWYKPRRPILVSGQAEAIWFDTGRKRRYGIKHILKRRIRK